MRAAALHPHVVMDLREVHIIGPEGLGLLVRRPS